jgi:hypothetical protein
MGITKNKIQLLDKILSVETEMDIDYWCNWWDYSYEDYSVNECGCSECNDYWGGRCIYEGSWEYLNDNNFDYNNTPQLINTFRYGKILNKQPIFGRMIDMDSIYSKERLREKKINQILGLEPPSYLHKSTVGDFFPKEN